MDRTVTREYIKHQLELLDAKMARKRTGLIIGDRKRYQDLHNAITYLDLYESFNKINEEFNR